MPIPSYPAGLRRHEGRIPAGNHRGQSTFLCPKFRQGAREDAGSSGRPERPSCFAIGGKLPGPRGRELGEGAALVPLAAHPRRARRRPGGELRAPAPFWAVRLHARPNCGAAHIGYPSGPSGPRTPIGGRGPTPDEGSEAESRIGGPIVPGRSRTLRPPLRPHYGGAHTVQRFVGASRGSPRLWPLPAPSSLAWGWALPLPGLPLGCDHVDNCKSCEDGTPGICAQSAASPLPLSGTGIFVLFCVEAALTPMGRLQLKRLKKIKSELLVRFSGSFL
ncbi:uncharacterized protein LOC101788419 [Cavia porcellus]|uniref:uncharacterized protein LOC101788419 n=1 Tax=Cavia porcellus TaxID=10141 RepID=UPI002FE01DE4